MRSSRRTVAGTTPCWRRGPRDDDQFKLRRLLDGQVGGRGAAENLVHVTCGAPSRVSEVRAVAHQARQALATQFV